MMNASSVNFFKGTLYIAKRELVKIITNVDLLMICFLAPMAYGFLLPYIYVYKQVDNISVGIVDEDKSNTSSSFARYINASQDLNIVSSYSTTQEALSDIKSKDINAVIYIPKNFSSSLKKNSQSNLFIIANSSNMLVANPILQTASAMSLGLSAKIFYKKAMSLGISPLKMNSLVNPIDLEIRPMLNPSLYYSNFMIPALFIIILQQLILVGLGFSIADEKEHNRVFRVLSVARGNRAAIVIGKSLPYIFLNLSIGIFFVTVLAKLFEVGSYFNFSFSRVIVISMFVSAVAASGILISSLFKNTLDALIVLMFYSMPAFLVSGYAWPKFALPAYLKFLGYFFPSTYIMNDFRSLMLENLSLSYYIPTLISLTVFTCVAWVLAYFSIKYGFKVEDK